MRVDLGAKRFIEFDILQVPFASRRGVDTLQIGCFILLLQMGVNLDIWRCFRLFKVSLLFILPRFNVIMRMRVDLGAKRYFELGILQVPCASRRGVDILQIGCFIRIPIRVFKVSLLFIFPRFIVIVRMRVDLGAKRFIEFDILQALFAGRRGVDVLQIGFFILLQMRVNLDIWRCFLLFEISLHFFIAIELRVGSCGFDNKACRQVVLGRLLTIIQISFLFFVIVGLCIHNIRACF